MLGSIRKVVLPAAGLGSRLLTATKEQPKEMLPLFAADSKGKLSLKPVLQLVFEQLYDFGFREFCFVVGRAKRAIEDQFTPDYDFVSALNSRGKDNEAATLSSFYRRLANSTIVWVNQPAPLGFGHAVLQAKNFVGHEPFMVHAGDTYIISKRFRHLRKLIEEFSRRRADAVLTLQEVNDPRQYGIADCSKVDSGLRVNGVVEKPRRPTTNLAIMPLYLFKPKIFEFLEALKKGVGGEIQLTDGIQRLITSRSTVRAVMLAEDCAIG